LIGVYGGMADPLPMLTMFDKQIQLADGPGQRTTLERRNPAAAPVTDDPLKVDAFATHHLPLSTAPRRTTCSSTNATAP
jgi:hypothetical protein